jgi:hypothetical protein
LTGNVVVDSIATLDLDTPPGRLDEGLAQRAARCTYKIDEGTDVYVAVRRRSSRRGWTTSRSHDSSQVLAGGAAIRVVVIVDVDLIVDPRR